MSFPVQNPVDLTIWISGCKFH